MDPRIDLLRARFGIDALRGFQRDAIDAVLRAGGRDGPSRVLLVAPTGGGKSLCYQLPAALLDGTALVLSPLIALMEDQVRALAARGVPATYLASCLPREENARRLAALYRGAYKIVYAAPERLASPGFVDGLARCRLSLVAVDEAHCIVQWGHSYRPEYLRIGEALDRLRPARAIACTATATPDARAEIVRRLGWQGAPVTEILRGFARPNLHLAARAVSGPREAHQEAARALFDALGPPAGGERGAGEGAAIVYTATRRGAELVAGKLRERGFAAAPYHAGLEPARRAEVSAAFAARSLPVVVATNAFGMGIDRPDVRVVVHAQPPASIEAYYQEVGRAGRDGAPARGLLLVAGADIALRRRLAATGENGAPASAEDAARAWQRFRELLRYFDAGTCRHDFILRFFGDDAESLGGCGHCDVCLAAAREPAALEESRDVVRRALSGVARARGAAGMGAIASMLAGEGSARVARAGLDRLSTFGVLAGRTPSEAMGVLRVLLANDWIDLGEGDYPVPRVTRLGWQVLRGEVAARVHLPAARMRAQRLLPAAPPVPAPAPVPVPIPVPAPAPSALSPLSLSPLSLSPLSPLPPPAPSPSAPCPLPAPAPAPVPAPVPAPPPRVTPIVESALARGMDASLFEALRARRATFARARAVPPYIVAPDRTLTEIALVRPRSGADLELCHGMGPARVAAYGEGFLAVVRAAGP